MKNRKLLVPVNGTEGSVRSVLFAGLIGSLLGCEVEILYLADPERFRKTIDLQLFVKDLSSEITQYLNRLKKDGSILKKVQFNTESLKDEVAAEIIDYSNTNDIDFIVMFTEVLNGDDQWDIRLKRKTAYNVVLNSELPVFTCSQLPLNPKISSVLLPVDFSSGTLQKIKLVREMAASGDFEIILISQYETGDEKDQLIEIQELAEQLLEGISTQNILLKGPKDPMQIINYAEQNETDLIVIMTKPSDRISELFITPGAKKYISFSRVPVLSVNPVDE